MLLCDLGFPGFSLSFVFFTRFSLTNQILTVHYSLKNKRDSHFVTFWPPFLSEERQYVVSLNQSKFTSPTFIIPALHGHSKVSRLNFTAINRHSWVLTGKT